MWKLVEGGSHFCCFHINPQSLQAQVNGLPQFTRFDVLGRESPALDPVDHRNLPFALLENVDRQGRLAIVESISAQGDLSLDGGQSYVLVPHLTYRRKELQHFFGEVFLIPGHTQIEIDKVPTGSRIFGQHLAEECGLRLLADTLGQTQEKVPNRFLPLLGGQFRHLRGIAQVFVLLIPLLQKFL